MSWLRKRRDGARNDDALSWTDAPGEGDDASEPTLDVEKGSALEQDQGAVVAEEAPETVLDRSNGPWDRSEVPSTEGYVDLGSLWLRGRDGMELRLELDEATQQVTAATVQLNGSAVQLQVFAAPRTTGIWADIRTEIAAGLTRQGGTADEVPGVFGRELLARVPVPAPDGSITHQATRFCGIDGPRWFLRAVFHGPAAYESAPAAELESVVREVVVVRGADAMAPRELLPLRLPDAAVPAPDPEPEGSLPSLDPFERGPEITETR